MTAATGDAGARTHARTRVRGTAEYRRDALDAFAAILQGMNWDMSARTNKAHTSVIIRFKKAEVEKP